MIRRALDAVRAAWRRNTAIPPAPADTLGAATLPNVKETGPSLTQGGQHVSDPYKLPHVVLDTRGGPVPEAAIDIIGRWEGFREDAYLCPADVWTIGYGTTRWPDGRRVKAGDKITQREAEKLLRQHAQDFATAVDKAIAVPLNANERAALISLAYNIGASAFAASTLARVLNEGKRDLAAEQFGRWNKAGVRVLPGLVQRRAEEARLFRRPV